MGTYLLTWNPKKWSWDNPSEAARDVRSGIERKGRWSCGTRRTLPIGSRVFLLRQGSEPKGIFASGWVTREPFPDEHWNESQDERPAHYIEFDYDYFLDPASEPLLDPRLFRTGPLASFPMNTQGSGHQLPNDLAVALEHEWAIRTGQASVGNLDVELSAFEGQKRARFVVHREREAKLREAKIREALLLSEGGRLRCEVPGCGFDFEEVYGAIGKAYAHVHHLRPLAECEEAMQVTLRDLAIVCANCHAMIHRGGECRPLSALIKPPR